MPRKNVSPHATMRVMQEVTLPELLKRARGVRSMREMARQAGIAVTSIKALEDGETRLPSPDTMPCLSRAYGVPLDSLALAAYGALYEEVPAGADDTALSEDGSPPDSNAAWPTRGTKLRHASALT